MKLLIDECLHTSLVEVAHAAGHTADHVNYLGLGGYKDWQLMARIREQEYTLLPTIVRIFWDSMPRKRFMPE